MKLAHEIGKALLARAPQPLCCEDGAQAGKADAHVIIDEDIFVLGPVRDLGRRVFELLVATIGAGYAFALRQLGPRLAPAGTPIATRFQIANFSAGLLALKVLSARPGLQRPRP